MSDHNPEVIRRRLEEFRNKLLDTSPRNRLINLRIRTKTGSDIKKVVGITGESSGELYRILVEEGRPMKFHGKPDPQPSRGRAAINSEASQGQIEEEARGETATMESSESNVVDQTDLVLNTEYTVSTLQNKLLAIQRDAKVAVEEQGINILFLSLGTLTWYEDENSEEKRVSPLILVPVQLITTNGGGIRLKWDETEPGSNLSIAARLKRDFQILLPPFPDELDVEKYLKAIEKAVSEQKRWSVEKDFVALAFFSFAKYLMYLDLDSSNWPEANNPIEHSTLGSILDNGFAENESGVTEEDFPEAIKPAQESSEVFDCDGSQTLAILEAQSGRSMIIEGPPGTGKSQTITNLIADYVLAGKRVLFVAEKATALDVVFRKLQEAHLSDACLELHSHKANKKAFYSSLKSTVTIAAPKAARAEKEYRQIEDAKTALNSYAQAVNTPLEFRGISPRVAMGELIRLGSDDGELGRHDFQTMSDWSQDDFVKLKELVSRLQSHVKKIGKPSEHPYFGCTLDHYLPQDLKDIGLDLNRARTALKTFHKSGDHLANMLRVELPVWPADIDDYENWATFVAHAPALDGIDIKKTKWDEIESQIRSGIDTGLSINRTKMDLAEKGAEVVPSENLLAAFSALKLVGLANEQPMVTAPNAGMQQLFSELKSAAYKAAELNNLSRDLAQSIGATEPKEIWGMESLAALAQRVANAPDIQDVSATDPAWRESYEDICKSIQSLREHKEIVSKFDSSLTPAAWNASVQNQTHCIQENNSKFFKFLNNEYKAAIRETNTLFKSIPKDNSQRLDALRAIQDAQNHKTNFELGETLLRSLFGSRWKSLESDPNYLRQVADWLYLLHSEVMNKKVPESILQKLHFRPDASVLMAGIEQLRRTSQQCIEKINLFRKELRSLGNNQLETGTGDATEKTYSWLNNILLPAHQQLLTEVPPLSSQSFYEVFVTLQQIVDLSKERLTLESLNEDLSNMGYLWKSELTDWTLLESTFQWLMNLQRSVESGNLPEGLITFFAEKRARDPLSSAVDHAQLNRRAAQDAIRAVLLKAKLHDDPDQFTEEPISRQMEKLEGWEREIENLPQIIQYNVITNEAHTLGLGQSVELAESWDQATEQLLPSFERAWYTGLVREAMKSRPIISSFDRKSHEEILALFKELDTYLLTINRIKVALAHWKNVPRSGIGGSIGWLKTQFELKRKHKPIRTAMKEAGDAVQQIKPVFLMSPLSVAMYLPPEGPKFDVVIFDEASQVKPEDAFGGIARADQTIVVGDSKQMPPTSFFDKLTESEEDEELEEIDNEIVAMKDIESVLAMFSSKIPEISPRRRDLRWHYRSRHDGLISTSNRLFYKDRLVVFPNPWRSGTGAGLIFRYDPTTIYERGNSRSRTNPLEAKQVAQAAYEHIRRNPRLSLGIATFSKAQQRAIQDELFLLQQKDPMFETFDSLHPFEPLVVKNLENIQGDERDVIFISVGYGKDESGVATANFGPLSRDGGERRLNVLITRARVRCEVFSNIKSGDVRLSDRASLGVRSLKTFLAFADTGSLDVPAATAREPESPFEEMVLSRLRLHGFDVDPQVGSCGYFIDMAVKHPEQLGRYVLGIECDGAMYHSARSARDRDKLRQMVLESRGWEIHRIWSTDWFRNEDHEFQRLVTAIQRAIAVASEGEEFEEVQPLVSEYAVLDREDIDADLEESATIPYEEWNESLDLGRVELHEYSTYRLSDIIHKIVELESPIHEEELVRRIREAAGLKKAGSRIVQHLNRAIQKSTVDGKVEINSGFLYWRDQETITVRDRSHLPQQARKFEKIAPEEIMEAFRQVVSESFGIQEEECFQLVAKKFGFDRTTAQMSLILRTICKIAIHKGIIVFDKSILRVSSQDKTAG